ncbi:MAG: ABC transporter substrate-binding protein [Hamadaea sp.]|nr:ABC transporter substrate-binding protein [Hamadaea sp.]
MQSDRATPRALRRPSARRPARAVAAAAATFLALGLTAACDSAASSDSDAPVKGGTLRVYLASLPTHLDPQQINLTSDSNVSRLITRTLTTVKSEPGAAASEIVPDLATDTGRPSDGNKTWEFRLRDGVKWQDGAAINCQHLKYGAERNFSDLMLDGLPYARAYLEKTPATYAGPFEGNNNDGKGLESVECVDARTIRYHLKQAVGDFGYAVALPIFAPVRAEVEGRDRKKYDLEPMSTGPYKVGPRTEESVTLVRNDNWDPSTDQVRKAYPDQIQLLAALDSAKVTNQLIANEGADQSAIMIDQDVAPNFLQQVVNDPELAARTASGPTGGVRYFAINAQQVKDVKCRQALAFAFDKRKFRTALGGSIMGQLATSMIPPSLSSHKEFDVYGTNTHPEGDVQRAAQLLKEAKCDKKIRVGYREQPAIKRLMKPLIEMYLKVGIEITPVGYPSRGYYTTVSDPGLKLDMIYAGWLPDWANGSAVIPPLFDGRALPQPGSTGTNNYSFFHNDEIERLIDEAMAEPDLERQYRLWGELDQKIMEQAAAIPIVYTDSQRIYGTNVTGVFISPMFAQPDLNAIGLKDPSQSNVS